MLILADLSGIQDYLFDVREFGGKQARSLRFRSLYVQLIAEAVSVRLLRAVNLDEDRLLFCAAGKLALDGTGLGQHRLDALHEEARQIGGWLRIQTQGRLRLSLAFSNVAGSVSDVYRAANAALQLNKLLAWAELACADHKWQPNQLIADLLRHPDEEAERDAQFGQEVTRPEHEYLVFDVNAPRQGSGGAFEVAGLSTSFAAKPPADSVHTRDLARLARHIPTDASGQAIEFVDLARRARGAPMLGVLKADADSLGQAIRQRMEGAKNLEPLRTFSKQLEHFFAQVLDQQMRKEARWSNLYMVFSGGDDVLLVGPWDIVLDFASYLWKLFTRQFKSDNLTISAGVALIKPRFPIRLAAHQAEDQLHHAKIEKAPHADAPKDQCSSLGQLWKWRDHEEIIRTGKQLADWVDAGTIQRSWLHTLLELVLLRRSDQLGRDPSIPPIMAASRLAYHVGRNWPKPNDRDSKKRSARQWIESVLDQFDQFETTSHVQTLYLPTILRYAMIATRAGVKEKTDE